MSAAPSSLEPAPDGYADWLGALKHRIATAQQRATRAVNQELVLLYWEIGRDILKRQANEGWGSKVIDRLARDLRTAFPDMKGFSARNLKYMRAFADAWPDEQFMQQAIEQLPYGLNLIMLAKLEYADDHRMYYASSIEYVWI